MTLQSDHLAWLRARNLSPATLRNRRNLLRRFVRITGCPLDGQTRATVRDFLARPGLSPSSAKAELTGLRTFYQWACLEGRILVDPTVRQPLPRLPRRYPRPMSREALTAALSANHDRVRLSVTLAAYAGLRAAEIAALRGEHVRYDEGVLIIVGTKGGGDSSVPLHPLVAAELRGWARTGPVVTWRGTGHVPPNQVSQAVAHWMRSHGFPDRLHQARHWFGTEAYRSSGRDLRATQELLRHRTVVSTQIYTYVDPGPLRGAVDGLPMVA